MQSQITQEHVERFQSLLTRSATDAGFRTKLLTEPRSAIAEFNGIAVADLPPSFDVVFLENKADATIVLPDYIDAAAELSADELEAVAGGVTPTVVVASLIGVFTVSVAVGTEIGKLQHNASH